MIASPEIINLAQGIYIPCDRCKGGGAAHGVRCQQHGCVADHYSGLFCKPCSDAVGTCAFCGTGPLAYEVVL
jgi:hypothetical protein